ncbi:MAG: RNA-protein complex protein Nop10 [Candidatus Thorarchaeota archaeon]|nr:RNA-protein complex protein Nop10 [Candidatus Thorarchaeota archaeon]
MPYLFKCSKCNTYTLSEKGCPKCGSDVSSPSPPRYSPQDKYGKYRREAKKKSSIVSASEK